MNVQIGILVFPNVQQFDLTGPYEVGRVVRDGWVMTGGGVTAGIDFALALVGEMAGRSVAEEIQHKLEYAPQPPFTAGTPATAPGVPAAGEPHCDVNASDWFRRLLKNWPPGRRRPNG